MIRYMRKIWYTIINPIRRLYWFVFRPRTYGVKCVVEYNGKLLLIRNSYGVHGWTFPGGGVKRNESSEQAAIREVKEEVGLDISNPLKIGEYQSNYEHKRDTVYCFLAKVSKPNVTIDANEIAQAQWFLPNEIPAFRSSAVDKILMMMS